MSVRSRKLDEALEWLKPLVMQQRYHISEFRALSQAQIALLNAEGDYAGAQRVRDLLNSMTGEDD
jgi:hypothetical protein